MNKIQVTIKAEPTKLNNLRHLLELKQSLETIKGLLEPYTEGKVFLKDIEAREFFGIYNEVCLLLDKVNKLIDRYVKEILKQTLEENLKDQQVISELIKQVSK